MHQRLHHVLKDHPVGDSRAVTTERMGRIDRGALRQQDRDLLPHGLQQAYRECRHGFLPRRRWLDTSRFA